MSMPCRVIAALLVAASVGAQDGPDDGLQRLPNLNYAGRGYDILEGNPHPTAATSSSLVDPGWRSPIFDLEGAADGENTFLSEEVTYMVPAGVTARACPACSFEFESTNLLTSNSYKDSLRVAVEANFRGWGASFKASSDYQHVQERYEEENTMFVESSASCTFYCARMDSFTPPPLLDNFRVAVERLPLTFEADDYYGFISEFGTHYSREVTMGGLFGIQTEISSTAVQTLEEVGIDIQVAASRNALAASGGIDVLTEIEKETASTFAETSTRTREFSYGGRPVFKDSANDTSGWLDSVQLNPIPLDSTLDMVSDLLTDINFPGDESIDTKQYNLVVALSEYCNRLQSAGGIRCVDRDFKVERVALVGAPLDPDRDEPNDPQLEANWDDGASWVRSGQPAMTGVNMWFDVDGLATIQAVYAPDNLHYHITPQNWDDARTSCLDDNARLASIHNVEENQRFDALAVRVQNARVDGAATEARTWIGWNDIERDQIHIWEDGSEVDYINEDAGNTRAGIDCVYHASSLSSFNGRWRHDNCVVQLPYMCTTPREHGTFPESITTPLKFRMDRERGEYINSVKVCEPNSGIKSLQFTTKNAIDGSTETSEVFSHGLVQQNSICFEISYWHWVSGEVIVDDTSTRFPTWESCQQLCLSDSTCTVWTWRGAALQTCIIARRETDTVLRFGEGHISCNGRECRDCSGDSDIVPINTTDCQTIEFSDRLGLVHLSGANGPPEPSLLDPTSQTMYMRVQSLGFHGFEESELDYVQLALLPAPPTSAATSTFSPLRSMFVIMFAHACSTLIR